MGAVISNWEAEDLKEIDKTVLDQFKSLLLKKVRLHRLILFGSRARGDAAPQSDMDVVVIIEGAISGTIKACISECAWEAGFERGIVIVPVIFTRDEWEHGPESKSLLVQAVKTEGTPV